MQRWMKYVLMGAPLAIFLAVTGYFYISYASTPYPEAETIGQGNPSFQEISDRFTALAEQKGAVYAFDVEKYAQLPPDIDTHLLGHVIGAVLYQQKGVNGIADCTEDFRNACSHAIVIGVMDEFGPSSATVSMIQAACAKAPGGSAGYLICFHGLGHGIFAYFGYDIPKAVAYCQKFGTAAHEYEEYPQCVGGIIMELVDGGGHDHADWVVANQKYFDANDPLAPCDTSLIPDAAKSYCYEYLTPHLFVAAGMDLNDPDPNVFPKAFAYCDAITDENLKDACYGSFGKEFIPLVAQHDIRNVDQLSDSEYQEAISWCMTGTDERIAVDCVQQAVDSIFWGGENDPQASFRFCSLVPDPGVQDACYSMLANGIGWNESGQERTTLCQELPSATLQKACENTNFDPSKDL